MNDDELKHRLKTTIRYQIEFILSGYINILEVDKRDVFSAVLLTLEDLISSDLRYETEGRKLHEELYNLNTEVCDE